MGVSYDSFGWDTFSRWTAFNNVFLFDQAVLLFGNIAQSIYFVRYYAR